MNREIRYVILLPAEYEHSTASFPVVYLLHGMGDDETAWCDGGSFARYADYHLEKSGPVIYVMPQGFNIYWINKYNGLFPYSDMLIHEMVPMIDSAYRTIPDAGHRAVIGYSMGGYGAIVLPAKHPGVFRTGVALSSSFRTDRQYQDEPQNAFDYQWAPVFGGYGTSGAARLTDYYLSFSPLHFFSKAGDPSGNGQNYYIDCGDDEENLSEPNDALHVLLSDLDIRHEYRVSDGAHNWEYWHEALPEALEYIGYAFQGTPFPDNAVPPETGPAVAADRVIEEPAIEAHPAFRIVLPSGYSADTTHYPVIVCLHHRDSPVAEKQSSEMIGLLSNEMAAKTLKPSLIVEIPVESAELKEGSLSGIMSRISAGYRVKSGGKYAVILGNGPGGGMVYRLSGECDSLFNACLLFDATLPDTAAADPAEPRYYLDACDRTNSYKGYHSLVMDLKKKGISYEYRVRQGTQSHDSFLGGLKGSIVFIRNQLKY